MLMQLTPTMAGESVGEVEGQIRTGCQSARKRGLLGSAGKMMHVPHTEILTDPSPSS